MARALGPSQCCTLPFIHSLSGRDTTSYPFYTGKKAWITASKTINISALQDFANDGQSFQITQDVTEQAQELFIAVYKNKSDNFSVSDLGKLRVYKFLNKKTALLKLLPPSEGAFCQHLQLAALATIIDKTTHIAKPMIPSFEQYGWTLNNGAFSPVTSNEFVYPQQMKKTMSCGCTNGCNNDCLCARNKIS